MAMIKSNPLMPSAIGQKVIGANAIKPSTSSAVVQPNALLPSNIGQKVIGAQVMPPSAGMKKGGKVSSASKRADGCAQRGKTRGKLV